ncbi:hypothetical protein AB6A40_009191 [Gnathostoma spinigerum]|uniref:Major facilitator superfamily (MFS) profile domain-containing protein n=1 Tax=Gnathostoma spinigerum TaxID=75299 RepID=A0ABD6ETM6_9BILA
MTEETEIIRALDADRLLSEYGKYGRYQILSFLMCQFLQSLYAASLFVMPFIQVKNNFECHTNNQSIKFQHNMSTHGDNVSVQKFNETSKLNANIDWGMSMLYTFNILCRSPLVKEAGLMLFSAGAMLVVPIVSHFSDLYGRRKILLISLYSSVIFNTCAAFAPNFVLFVILRFLVGATSDVRDEVFMKLKRELRSMFTIVL